MERDRRASFPVVVHTLVFDEKKRLLLLRRSNTGFLDGMYALPGGHLGAGETIVEAGKRECEEEAGIEITTSRPISVLPFPGGIDFILEADRWFGDPRINEPDKCDEMDWFSLDDLPETTVPYLFKVLEMRAAQTWFHQYEEKA